MSKSRGCLIVEYEDGKWFAIVAQDEYDYEFLMYDVFGPTETEDACWDSLSHNCSNPGGGETVMKEDITDWMKGVIEKR